MTTQAAIHVYLATHCFHCTFHASAFPNCLRNAETNCIYQLPILSPSLSLCIRINFLISSSFPIKYLLSNYYSAPFDTRVFWISRLFTWPTRIRYIHPQVSCTSASSFSSRNARPVSQFLSSLSKFISILHHAVIVFPLNLNTNTIIIFPSRYYNPSQPFQRSDHFKGNPRKKDLQVTIILPIYPMIILNLSNASSFNSQLYRLHYSSSIKNHKGLHVSELTCLLANVMGFSPHQRPSSSTIQVSPTSQKTYSHSTSVWLLPFA